MERHELIFGGYQKSGELSFDAFKLKFVEDSSDNSKLRIEIRDKQNKEMHQEIGEQRIYRIDVLDEQGHNVRSVELQYNSNPNTFDFTPLTSILIEYGYKIKVTAIQPFRFKITGEIIGAKEDYSDAVQNKMNLEYVT